jgi:hypothetical protein
MHEEDYVNPTIDGMLSWRSISYCDLDFDKGLENWKKHLHEISARICVRMTGTLRQIGTKLRQPPIFYG